MFFYSKKSLSMCTCVLLFCKLLKINKLNTVHFFYVNIFFYIIIILYL